jgi:hypothetical protein
MNQATNADLKARSPIGGYVKNGRIFSVEPIPDGCALEIRVVAGPGEFTPEERAEFEAWSKLSDEALVNFERMVAEEGRNAAR